MPGLSGLSAPGGPTTGRLTMPGGALTPGDVFLTVDKNGKAKRGTKLQHLPLAQGSARLVRDLSPSGPSAGHLPLVMMASPSGQDSSSMVQAGQRAPSHPKVDDEAGSMRPSYRGTLGYLPLKLGTVPGATPGGATCRGPTGRGSMPGGETPGGETPIVTEVVRPANIRSTFPGTDV